MVVTRSLFVSRHDFSLLGVGRSQRSQRSRPVIMIDTTDVLLIQRLHVKRSQVYTAVDGINALKCSSIWRASPNDQSSKTTGDSHLLTANLG